MPERPPEQNAPPLVAATLQREVPSGAGARVTASGHGALAERIVALADEAGVPHYEDPHLARLLAQVDLGEEIPPGLYAAVAEVIAFVWSLDDAKDESAFTA